MSKFGADKWTLQYFLDAVGQHYAQAWMADYDADEVGEFLLTQYYHISQTGSYRIDVKSDTGWKATRTEFLLWRYEKARSKRTG